MCSVPRCMTPLTVQGRRGGTACQRASTLAGEGRGRVHGDAGYLRLQLAGEATRHGPGMSRSWRWLPHGTLHLGFPSLLPHRQDVTASSRRFRWSGSPWSLEIHQMVRHHHQQRRWPRIRSHLAPFVRGPATRPPSPEHVAHQSALGGVRFEHLALWEHVAAL